MISLVNVIKSLGNKICSRLLKKFLIQTINFLNESYEYIFTLQFPVFFKHTVLLVLLKMNLLNTRYLTNYYFISNTKNKMFSIEGFFSKCEQIRSFLRIWSHLLKKSLMENLISCAVFTVTGSHKQIPFDSISKYKSNRAMTFRTMTNI